MPPKQSASVQSATAPATKQKGKSSSASKPPPKQSASVQSATAPAPKQKEKPSNATKPSEGSVQNIPPPPATKQKEKSSSASKPSEVSEKDPPPPAAPKKSSVKNAPLQAAATKRKGKKPSKGSVVSVKNAPPAPKKGKASKGSQQIIKPKLGATGDELNDATTNSADEPENPDSQSSLPAASISPKESSTVLPRGGDESEYYFGMYRRIHPTGAGRLKPVHKAFNKFHPWRPKGNWDDSCLQFITTGYYLDMDGGGGAGDLKPNQVRVNNLPPKITEEEIQKEFPFAIKFDIDGTAVMDFNDPPTAEKAYYDSTMVHMGDRNLAWKHPDEVYLLGVPDGKTTEDLETDYPGNKGIRFLENTGTSRVAVIKFATAKSADDGFEEAPFKKIGKHQHGYDIEEATLHISDVPPSVTAADLQEKFPGAKDIHIDSTTGHAKLEFEDDKQSRKAYNETDMPKLGRPKLLWLKPEEMTLENVPNKLKENDLKKDFPTAKKIRFMKGEGGRRIAVMEFPSVIDQKKAYESSGHKKVGPSRLGWSKGGGAKPDKNAQLKISDIPKGAITEADLKKKFPGATDVKLHGGNAIIQYGSRADADKGYKESDMAKLGDNKLVFLKPTQIALQDMPKKNEKAVKKDMPDTRKIHWLNGPNKTKVAILEFDDAEKRKTNFDNSVFKKIGPQTLGFDPEGGPLEDVDDMELAQQLWKLKGADFSNISNLFSASIKLIGVPQSTKGVDLIKMFEDCKKCDFEGAGNKRTAILTFDNPTSAAKAYSKAKNTKIDGKDVRVAVVPLGGKKKSKSARDTGEKKSSGVAVVKKSASTTAGIKKSPASSFPSKTSVKK